MVTIVHSIKPGVFNQCRPAIVVCIKSQQKHGSIKHDKTKDPWLEKVGNWGTWFLGNLVIWREIYEFETKKYKKCWEMLQFRWEIPIMFLGNLTCFPAMQRSLIKTKQ